MPKKFDFGLTQWGAYFIRAMEGLADEARLRRGRSYAANGNVLKLVIKDGTAKAMVEGSYEPWYDVEISFKPLERKDRDVLSALIDKDPMLVGRIMAGELPMELIERLEKAGVRLLPTRWQDMRRSCSCPDYGDPCKHMAAVYYVLAQEIDRDPSVLFRLRGFDLAGKYSSEGAPVIANPLDLRMVKPWEMNANSKMPQLTGIGAYGKAIIRLLPPPPPLVPYDLKNALADFYADLDRRWERILGIQTAGEFSEARLRAFTQSKVSIQLPKAQGSPKETRPYFLVTVAGGKKERLSPLETVRICLAIDQNEGSAGYVFLRTFSHVMRMIVAAGAIIPDIGMQPAASSRQSDKMRVVWKPAQFGADVRDLLDVLETVTPPALSGTSGAKVPDAHSTVLLLAADLFSDIVGELRYLPKNVSDISHPVTTSLFRGEAADVSSPMHRSLPKAMDSWLSVFDVSSSKFRYELVIKHRTSRASQTTLPRYVLSATVKMPSAPFGQVGKGRGLAEGRKSPERLALSKAAQQIGTEILTFPAMLSSFIPELIRLGSKTSVVLSEEELSRFVIESAPLLAQLGVTVVLPKELKTLLKPRPVLSAKRRKGSGNLVSFMNMNAMLSFEWNVAIGDVVISATEFERMVSAGTELVKFRDDYLRLEASEAASILERIKKGPKPDAFDALHEYLTGETTFDETLEKSFAALLQAPGPGSMKGGKPTRGVEGNRETADDGKTLIPLPAGLCATLRPYQERGFRWIATTLERGFGCILADDMGLGKTVQAIACILSLKETGTLGRGALVCAPATLLTNWERELERFAPSLSLSTYYGVSRQTKAVDVTLTSYETFQRDQKKLADREWDLVVLDEAHLIKNPDTKRSKALKLVKSSRRLALSGTPVENHLGELWSIFDFVLPGYLRTLDRFARDYRKPIEVEKSSEHIARLRCITAPFLMRRLKLDKSIIADLPDKIVTDEYANLTPEQAALYESVVRDYMAKIEASEGIARRGLILALITALKQVCNHPRNYDKESDPATERSGKTRLLAAILDVAMEADEKVLVFSQYVEMLGILRTVIEHDLGVEPFILHGGLTKTTRDAAIDGFKAFQGPSVFLISLKAGGLGLNLTEATRVIHYDLWFNPAVENQATDRAFRIGQRKNVFVHRLITKDSFEEKINATLSAKRELAELTVSEGETWLTELGNAELAALVKR